jgi:hypothetical protein
VASAAFSIGELLIPRINPAVIHAINMAQVPEKVHAVGVLEYYSATGSIIAADFAVKILCTICSSLDSSFDRGNISCKYNERFSSNSCPKLNR